MRFWRTFGIDSSALLHSVAAGVAIFLGGCSSGGGGGGSTIGIPGQELVKPGGGTYFVDQNSAGRASRLHLAEVFWARLVDIHDVDSFRRVNPQPRFRDFTISESVQSDGNNYVLDTNPITQRTRLVVLREYGAPDTGFGTFDSLLRSAANGLPPVQPKHDDGSTGDQYSLVARNGTLVLRFDDLLDDDLDALTDLPETVKLLAGYPPVTPFPSRIIFDPNHGGVVGDQFHSTRVLIDLTISEAERADMVVSAPISTVGLPASLTTTTNPNVAVRIPSRVDFGSGQFELLRGLSGSPLAPLENGPVDRLAPTRPIVRAMRAGNSSDQNNGFLLDLNPPRIVSGWALTVDSALADLQGQPGVDYLLDLTFTTVCRGAPVPGDVISVGGIFLEVTEQNADPDLDGRVQDVRARSLSDQPLGSGTNLLGNALFQSTFELADPAPRGCWVTFSPQPTTLPATGVSPEAEILVRFSEPMDPSSISPFDNFYLVTADSNTPVNSGNLVVGRHRPSDDLKEFSFDPTLSISHQQGTAEGYHVRIDGPTDLAGNALAEVLPPINFLMAPEQPTVRTGGLVMRFNDTDEIPPIGLPDLRGQFFFDFDAGLIRPRPVAFTSYPADRTNPVPSIMIPFARGVATPLSPLGSKLHAVWRYCDLGWQVLDETKYNLDVFGLSWAPIGGTVVNDFYDNFEIRLSHSAKLPDEAIDNNLLPRWDFSGLVPKGRDFDENILVDPLSPQKLVHSRNLGYQINSANLFLSSSGRNMLPYPLNRGPGASATYVWRDTAVLAKGAPNGIGIPLDIEEGVPLFLEDKAGIVARPGQVPSFGLPLLIEYRVFPSNQGIGLNSLDISLAINSSPLPSFRSFSTGGFDVTGQAVRINPDEQVQPLGGYNPLSTPVPGARTPRGDDNAFYVGQLDVVTRIARVHTVWLDTDQASPDLVDPILLPDRGDQPSNTEVIVEFRGAGGFTLSDLDADLGSVVDESEFPFNAQRLNAYGDIFAIFQVGAQVGTHAVLGSTSFPGSVQFTNGTSTWSSDIDSIDGSRFVQMRFTFVSNIETGLSPELSAAGVAYSE
ncbi:MAG: Ig-like domain-containing protein [Planctomycetes bacterium]|nr:Ig-like domain-containing protein [Planctomycetota bacterium]